VRKVLIDSNIFVYAYDPDDPVEGVRFLNPFVG